jgi:hypothetical protein
MTYPTPQQKPFVTMAQVEAYLSQPRIRCLVCGVSFRSLGMHLKFHGMTADDYRIRFGIPFVCALEAPDLVQYRSRLEQEKARDPEYAARRAEHLANAQRAARTIARRPCPTLPDACDRLDEALLRSMGKAERMRQLRATLADGAAERAQARMERQQHERDYRQAYNARKAQRKPA